MLVISSLSNLNPRALTCLTPRVYHFTAFCATFDALNTSAEALRLLFHLVLECHQPRVDLKS